ncbi:uncharacterized protein MELLADRAFT_84326 [Melampsora larici-populina 98AG31]|uniref:Uncharacterized protein n=1 Tax=Melampsora larici-populina (strain 98AG31 / pathotype 3-4-7) TaxID=747676 RepID=F4RFC2_MELLP|nr:uncharacterized protein MELLADRAFT_84326 [Melampsora larici-populina 98AG31]EGG08790.1 hypothetical protein MELLADRAFT_84326 [Melampsora larici-populina 98AG31]
MRSRGFWRDGHYWCKVVRTVGGLTGVWYNNDMENDGMARLASRDLKTIAGASPSTSWVMYSRAPTDKESVIFKRAEEKINKAIGHKGVIDRPFSQSKNDADKNKDLSDPDWEDDKHLPEEFDTLNDSEDVKPLFCSDLEAAEEPTESKPQVQQHTNTNKPKSRKPKKVKIAEKCEDMKIDSHRTGQVEEAKVEQAALREHLGNDDALSSKNEERYIAKDIHTDDKQNVVTLPKKSQAKRARSNNDKPTKPKWKGWVIMDQEEEENKSPKGLEEAEDNEEMNDNNRRSKRIKSKR